MNEVRDLVRIILESCTHNLDSDTYTVTFSRFDVERLWRIAYGGSVSVPGATGVPGAPTTVPHQTPTPRGHEDDDGRSS